MVENVKLEIAIQIAAENIAEIYKKIEENKNPMLQEQLEHELAVAFDEKDRVAQGEIKIVEKILNERRNRNGK